MKSAALEKPAAVGAPDADRLRAVLLVRIAGVARGSSLANIAADLAPVAGPRLAASQWRTLLEGEVAALEAAGLVTAKPLIEATAAGIARAAVFLGLNGHLPRAWDHLHNVRLIAKALPKLPLRWTKESVGFGERSYNAAEHVPVLIYPNPLNPKRYVVVNSGFTYREYDYLNNARQVPKLPDWAVIDINEPVTSRLPGKVVDAAFFNEAWQMDGGRE